MGFSGIDMEHCLLDILKGEHFDLRSPSLSEINNEQSCNWVEMPVDYFAVIILEDGQGDVPCHAYDTEASIYVLNQEISSNPPFIEHIHSIDLVHSC